MDTPTKNKSLVSIIVFLLLTNIAMLIFFLFLSSTTGRGHGRDENFMPGILQKQVGFNDNQINAYKKVKEEQMHKMKPLFEDVRTAKDNFYKLLPTNPSDSSLNASAAIIGQKQMALDIQMFQNLKSIRNLCTPEQVPKFDSSIKFVVARMTGRGRKPGGEKGK